MCIVLRYGTGQFSPVRSVSTVYFSLHRNQALGLARSPGRTGTYDESSNEPLYFHFKPDDDIED